jgi:putative aminopeptidase FrvX
VATDTQTGALQQPDAASASYAFAGDGSMVVSATWEPDATLSLSVTCPAGTQTQEGTSSISIEIADANGPCDVRLKEMIVQYAAVSYTVTVAPEDGS